MKILAQNCEFGALENSLIKDALVLGVQDLKLRKNFLLDPDLTLEKATAMARANERTNTEMNDI